MEFKQYREQTIVRMMGKKSEDCGKQSHQHQPLSFRLIH